MTRHDKTRQDVTRHDKTRHDKTRQDKTRQDTTRQDKTNALIYRAHSAPLITRQARGGVWSQFVGFSGGLVSVISAYRLDLRCLSLACWNKHIDMYTCICIGLLHTYAAAMASLSLSIRIGSRGAVHARMYTGHGQFKCVLQADMANLHPCYPFLAVSARVWGCQGGGRMA